MIFNQKEHLNRLSHGNMIACGQSSFNRLIRRYKNDARRHNRGFQLTDEQCRSLFKEDCHYCGTTPYSIQEPDGGNGAFIYNGIDRKDSKLGYEISNCVTCCKVCNRLKGDLGYDDFKNWVSRVADFTNGGKRKHSLVIGRFQCLPPHKGHLGIINVLLNEGKNVLIAIRDTDKDEKNPYSIEERRYYFTKIYKNELMSGRVKIIIIPDIEDVCYGRSVGWGIREIRLDAETELISATKIRNDTLDNG